MPRLVLEDLVQPHLAAYSSWWTTWRTANELSADSAVPDLPGAPVKMLLFKSKMRCKMPSKTLLSMLQDAGSHAAICRSKGCSWCCRLRRAAMPSYVLLVGWQTSRCSDQTGQ